MLKILHYGLTDNLGGIETYLFKLTSNINQQKFQFDFLILGNNIPCYYEELKEMGCNFYFVTERTKNIYKNYKDIKKVLEDGNYDIVHCHLNSLSYITPALTSLKMQIPTIVHSRNAGIPSTKKSRLLHAINYHRLPKDKITKLAVSDFAGEWMFGKESKVEVINNGIDIDKYKFDAISRKIIRDSFEIKDDEYLVIHTGALREQKNHHFLLDIFNEISQLKDSAKLILVGSGKLENEIKAKINQLDLNDKVIMTGNRMDIPDLLSAGDFYLFPSLYEGFPNSVIEAETSGLPCLISDTITKEVVINLNCKQKSLKASAQEWAETVLSLGEKSFLREDGAIQVEKNGFSVENEIKKIESIYENISK